MVISQHTIGRRELASSELELCFLCSTHLASVLALCLVFTFYTLVWVVVCRFSLAFPIGNCPAKLVLDTAIFEFVNVYCCIFNGNDTFFWTIPDYGFDCTHNCVLVGF